MLRFLLLYLLIYGLLNFYGFWKLRGMLHGQVAAQVALGAFVTLMVFGPILVRTVERAGWGTTALGLGLVTYCWMAALLWFDTLAAALDLWNLALGGAARRWPSAERLILSPGRELAVIGVLVAAVALWSLFDARRMRLERVRLKTAALPRGSALRIVQISDVHLGLIERRGRLEQILRIIERTRPDLLVSTGDLLDGTGDHLNHLHERLEAVRPRLGKFAVTGNHEYYVGIGPSVTFHQACGFRLLRGEAVDLDGGRLRLAGVDDPTGQRLGHEKAPDEPALLGPRQAGRFTLLLKHQPRVDPRSLGRFDLMLSGHTHRGQIIPFNFVVRLFFKYLSGTHPLSEGSVLHVSRGSGTWGPPMRLGSPPEVTLITLEGR